MTVTVTGTIMNSGTEELDGTLIVTANKNFFDVDGFCHLKDKSVSVAFEAGEFEIELAETINYEYENATLTDSDDIITFTSLIDGEDGNDITITIEDGSVSGSKITINEGETSEEIYDNLNMDETTPSTYIVDYITSNSSLVSVTRESDLSDDSLPANMEATNLTGGTTTNQIKYEGTIPVKYKFEFLDENGDLILIFQNIEITYSSSPIEFSSLL